MCSNFFLAPLNETALLSTLNNSKLMGGLENIMILCSKYMLINILTYVKVDIIHRLIIKSPADCKQHKCDAMKWFFYIC